MTVASTSSLNHADLGGVLQASYGRDSISHSHPKEIIHTAGQAMTCSLEALKAYSQGMKLLPPEAMQQ